MHDSRPRRIPEPTRDPAPWREPVRGGHLRGELAARPGLDQMRGLLTGETPAPPLEHLLGLRAVSFDPGEATFEMPLTGWLGDAGGAIPLGPLTIPADAAMARAVITGLPPYTGLTTAELSLRQVRPALPGTTVRAHARRLEAGPPVALAEVTLTDGEGRLIAHGASLCVALAGIADPVEPPERSGSPEPSGSPKPLASAGRPDPWRRPAPPADDPLGPPLERLTGLRQVAEAPGEATFVLPATRWLCAPPPGRVQGGAVATLADAAITAAIRTVAAPGGRFVPVELKLNFLRPLASDGREARAEARLIHGGRRIGVARAEVVDADGRAIAFATGSAVAQPAARS